MSPAPDSILKQLQQLVGTWTTQATHPAMPGVVVHGSISCEWLEGERFLIHRARTDHPQFPDSISIIGFTEHDRVDKAAIVKPEPRAESALSMHYYDSRGVFRVYQASFDAEAWRLERMAPGFSQRFMGTFTDAGNTMRGSWQLSEDDVHWHDDLQITYQRAAQR